MSTFFRRNKCATKRGTQRAATRKPCLEILEDRTLPSAIITNGSFETPRVPMPPNHQYNPPGGTWVFNGTSGIVETTNSQHTFEPPGPAPDGTQVAFLQYALDYAPGFSIGDITQSVNLPGDGLYTLTYKVGGRGINTGSGHVADGNLSYGVYIDGTLIASDSTTTSQQYTLKTYIFVSTAGPHSLEFRATSTSGDHTAFFDVVDIEGAATDIAATKLDWNTAQGGVDFGYTVSGAALTQDTTAQLYWASGTTTDTILEPAATPIPIPKTTPLDKEQTVHLAPSDFPGGPAPGAKYLLAVVDPDNKIAESDETNNVLALQVRPDIAMLSAQLVNGNTVQFTYQTTGEPGSFQMGLYQSADGVNFDKSSAPIATGTETPTNTTDPQTGNITIPSTWTPDPTKPFIVVDANPDQSVMESSYNNNTANVLLPDIEMSHLTAKDSSRSLEFTYTVTGGEITAPVTVRFYRFATSTQNPSPDDLLNTGSSVTIADTTPGEHHQTVPLTAPLGIDPSHPFIIAVADPDGSLAESNETNDTASFRKIVIGVVTHGQQVPVDTSGIFGTTPTWVTDMATGLVQDNQYFEAIPYNWVRGTETPEPGQTTVAGDDLAQRIAAAVAAIPGLTSDDVVDLHLIGHSRGAVVISRTLQDIPFLGVPQLAGGYKKMTMLDPHPAHNYPGSHWYSEQPTLQAHTTTLAVLFGQTLFRDPNVVVPADVNEAEVYYQHTPSYMLPSSDTQPNLWGEVPVVNDSTSPVIYADLTGFGMGHSEVHDWYYDAVVRTHQAAASNPITVGVGWIGLGAPPHYQPVPHVESVVVNDGAVQRSLVNKLTVTFNTIVTIDYGAFNLTDLGGSSVTLDVSPVDQGGKTVVTITFSLFHDGNYSLTASSGGIFNTWPDALVGVYNSGVPSDYEFRFFRLVGDFNGDGVVDESDKKLLKDRLEKPKNQTSYDPAFDLNGDGVIDKEDEKIFKLLVGNKL